MVDGSWTIRPCPPDAARRLATALGVSPTTASVLARRGYDDPAVAQAFLAGALPAHDPFRLGAMREAVEALRAAIPSGRRICVHGDYDVDGICATALAVLVLRELGADVVWHLPSRFDEGYGLNGQTLARLADEGVDLVLTVDCGITAVDEVADGKRLGLEIVVTDHHRPAEELPDCPVVATLVGDYPFPGLCGTGVVYKLGQALGSQELDRHLDLVALATVADVVPLTGLNRAYVAQGLQVMRRRKNIGLKALSDAASLNEAPTPYHLGFILGPRINAGGRIGDAGLGARLLAGDDEIEAGRIAILLDRLNKERRALEKEMLEAALAEADAMVTARPDLPFLMVGSHTWHKGIVGLVASRLVERFRRPACVIAWEDEGGAGSGTGSLRSVAGADIGSAVREAVAAGHLVKGGGHAMAAGLTVERTKLATVQQFLEARLAASVGEARTRADLAVDGALTLSGVTDELLDLVERVGPFGQGNPSPRFAFPATHVRFAKLVGENHVRCVLEAEGGARLEAVAFRAAGEPLGDLLLGTGGLPIHVAGHLKRSSWNGRERIELMIEDAADPRRQR